MDRMFDEHSFQDEVVDAAHAKACVSYLAHNESNFKKELAEEGLDYDQIQEEVKKVWLNLLKACKRVGFEDHITRAKAAQYGFKG